MLDLEGLFSIQPAAAAVSQQEPTDGNARHSGHNRETPNLSQVCPSKPLQHKGFTPIDTADTADTVHLQGDEYKNEPGAPGKGAASNRFALHPAAVCLLLTYCHSANIAAPDIVSWLIRCQALEPGEQVRYWHGRCVELGIKPWEVLMVGAPPSGSDCTMCKHLTTKQMNGDSGRREFHWACGLGYLILETGRGTERIWIAPPECSSFERWRPQPGPSSSHITYKADLLSRG